MKTVIDAVNEFEGEFPSLRYTTDNWYEDGCDLFYREKTVCSKIQFNSKAAECAIDSGKSMTYGEYKANFQGITTDRLIPIKSDKELEKMDILSIGNWYEFSDDNIKWELGILQDISTSTPLTYQSKDGNKSEWYTSVRKVVAKPEPNLTYTQAMADNGELPSVGMECLIKMIGAYLPVTITYNSEHVIAFTYKTDNGVVETCKQKELHNIDIKPLTPPIALIDGGRYEIEFCFGDYRMVYYKKSNHSFYDSILCDSKVCHASSVKNIQPLTVEVK